MWTKILALIIVATLALGTVGCGDSSSAKYQHDMSELTARRKQLLSAVTETNNEWAKDDGGISASGTADVATLQNAMSSLVDKYTAIYQGYYSELEKMTQQAREMTPPTAYKKFHGLYVKSCEGYLDWLESISEGLAPLKHFDTNTQVLMQKAQAHTDQLLESAKSYNDQAIEAYPGN